MENIAEEPIQEETKQEENKQEGTSNSSEKIWIKPTVTAEQFIQMYILQKKY